MLLAPTDLLDRPAPATGTVTAPPSASRLPPADPLGEDAPEDIALFTTERRLQRLAIVACDAGARFAREGLVHDPVAWMLAPRALFDGARALEACQGREAFIRATLLHGLSLGLDADPDELDALTSAGPDDEEDGAVAEVAPMEPVVRDGPVRLYTCSIEGRLGSGGSCVQAFCAMVAADAEVVRRRLRVRYGERLADAAMVVEGFEGADAVARSLLSTSVSRMLAAVAADPAGGLGEGFDLQIEQRFRA